MTGRSAKITGVAVRGLFAYDFAAYSCGDARPHNENKPMPGRPYRVLQAALSQPFAYSRAWYDTRTAMLVEIEIETDDGLIGRGEKRRPLADRWRPARHATRSRALP